MRGGGGQGKIWKKRDLAIQGVLTKQGRYEPSANYDCRQNNIEIQGVPQSIKGKDLEDKVLLIFEKVNVKVTKSDKEQCHQMSDDRKMILRFVNCKYSFDKLSN